MSIMIEQNEGLTIVRILTGAGFHCFHPHGAYYVMTDISSFGFPSDTNFASYMVEHTGVAAVPGSSFYQNTIYGSQQIRFCLPFPFKAYTMKMHKSMEAL